MIHEKRADKVAVIEGIGKLNNGYQGESGETSIGPIKASIRALHTLGPQRAIELNSVLGVLILK